MKLEILKDHLEQAVASAGRVSNKNLSLPVLGCVVLVATPERTVVRATNLDVSVEIAIKAKVTEEGMVAVPAQVLTQAVSTATDQKLTLSTKDNVLSIVGSHGEAKLKTLDTSEFPTLSYVKEGDGVTVSLPTKELVRALKSVSFAASTSGMRPELASVFFEIQNNTLTTAATDSFRLAESKTQMKNKQSADPVLIPARNIADVIRVLQDGDTTELRVSDAQCTFISGGSYITSRIIDGAFPDYQAIIPKSTTSTATMLTEDVLRAFRKVAVFTDAYSQVEVAFLPSKKEFSIRAANSQVGETHEAIDATLEGEDITMNFNVKYILDALQNIHSDSIVFKLAGVGKPMVVEEIAGAGFMCLVMPMNK